jgi:hypothetical protein
VTATITFRRKYRVPKLNCRAGDREPGIWGSRSRWRDAIEAELKVEVMRSRKRGVGQQEAAGRDHEVGPALAEDATNA